MNMEIEWCDCTMKHDLQKPEEILRTYFGFDSFRTGQKQVIDHVLSGKDTLCVMPTGGGKSLCYQVPALVLDGTAIIISPLISLMKDQVDILRGNGIPAAFINSSLSYEEMEHVMYDVRSGHIKLLYLAPERLENSAFCQQLAQLKVPLIAIDEAHCISEWGHDFRPSYRSIPSMLSLCQVKPTIIALTATATPSVCEDICHLLNIQKDNIFHTGFARENLIFKVYSGENKERYIKQYLKNNPNESGIIYAATRKSVDSLYENLLKQGFSVAKYHAGMNEQERVMAQNQFLRDEKQIMVATNAFGMGINKTNVRFVIHYQMPKNMESYYQEAGRAGRDGLQSECILLYSPSDEQTQRYLIEQTKDSSRLKIEFEKLQKMVDYCHTENCLQAFIVQYFGDDEYERCGKCSNCTDHRPIQDVTEDAQKVLSCVVRMGQRFGKTMTAQVLAGSKSKNVSGFGHLSTYGILKNMSIKEIGNFIEFLIAEEILLVKLGKMPTIYVSEEGKEVLLGRRKVFRRKVIAEQETLQEKDPLFEYLRMIRKEIAMEEGVPPFVVFSDKTLRDMCLKRPMTEEAFLEVNGVGINKFEKYGERFIAAIQKFCLNI